MDARKKAAQATIDFYTKTNVKLLSKNSHGPYSDSDTSSCEEQYVSNLNLPSLTSLKYFTRWEIAAMLSRVVQWGVRRIVARGARDPLL